MKKFLVVFKVVALLVALSFLVSCAGTINAIDNMKMTTVVKMSDSIFLEPQTLAKNRTVYIRVTNTSDLQEMDFAAQLKDKMAKYGITPVETPENAGYIIQANILYMDYAKDNSMTADGMLAGGFGGGLLGYGVSRDTAGSIIGAVVGSVVGAIAGSTVKVEQYYGVVDVQIQEKTDGVNKAVIQSNSKQGESTVTTVQREFKTDYITYRTRLVGTAKQTNLDRVEAGNIMSERIATQIAGFFKL